ncbi:MAG: hypothetical protein WBI63_06600 [Coriobacteriia bacterium]
MQLLIRSPFGDTEVPARLDLGRRSLWLSARPFDEVLARRLTVLKVRSDVVDDGLGDRPFDPEDVLRCRSADEFQPEAIGYLTTPLDVPRWIEVVRERFGVLRDLDESEMRYARYSKEWEVRQLVAALSSAV